MIQNLRIRFHHDKYVRRFVKFVRLYCATNNVEIILSPERAVDMGESQLCSGYFYADYPEEGRAQLVVATGKPLYQWMSIFVHEFGHCQQWVEDDIAWNMTSLEDKTDVLDKLWDWLAGKTELDQEEAQIYSEMVGLFERDCDKRAIRLIKEWRLPLDVVKYRKKANAYHLFYSYIGKNRTWYTVGKEPYNVPEIWAHMPGDRLIDMDEEDVSHLLKIYDEVYNEQ